MNHQTRVYNDVFELLPSEENPTPMVRINKMSPSREFRGRTHLIDPHHRRGIFLAGEQLEYVVIDPRLMVHLNRAGNLTTGPEGVSRPGAGRNPFKQCVLSSSSSSS